MPSTHLPELFARAQEPQGHTHRCSIQGSSRRAVAEAYSCNLGDREVFAADALKKGCRALQEEVGHMTTSPAEQRGAARQETQKCLLSSNT